MKPGLEPREEDPGGDREGKGGSEAGSESLAQRGRPKEKKESAGPRRRESWSQTVREGKKKGQEGEALSQAECLLWRDPGRRQRANEGGCEALWPLQ